jgi:hypothetical protein
MASYFETRYLAPTAGGKGSRIRVVESGSGRHVATLDYSYAATNAHLAAMQIVRNGGDIETCYTTPRGYVFRYVEYPAGVEVVA